MNELFYPILPASYVFDADLLACNTSDAVAAVLRERGVTGERENSQRCPIANYIRGRLELRTIRVYWGEIRVRATSVRYRVFPTAPIAEFVRRFDDAEYPDLELRADSRAEEILRGDED